VFYYAILRTNRNSYSHKVLKCLSLNKTLVTLSGVQRRANGAMVPGIQGGGIQKVKFQKL